MSKYQNEVRLFIVMSLSLLCFKSIIDAIFLSFADMGTASTLFLLILQAALAGLQVFSILKNKKWGWIFSLLQVGLLYFLSQGTFGWAFTYLFKSFTIFIVFNKFVLVGLLIVSELLKTLWLYKNTGK